MMVFFGKRVIIRKQFLGTVCQVHYVFRKLEQKMENEKCCQTYVFGAYLQAEDLFESRHDVIVMLVDIPFTRTA